MIAAASAWAGRLRGLFGRVSPSSGSWDLLALLSAADPKASTAERHLWLIRFVEWLRHAPTRDEAPVAAMAVDPDLPGTVEMAQQSAGPKGTAAAGQASQCSAEASVRPNSPIGASNARASSVMQK